MKTILDIDLDFFTSPIVSDIRSDDGTDRGGESVESNEDALDYLASHCDLPIDGKTPGAFFEHHDEVFDFALKHFPEPVHLIHVDAHADIGGGTTSCWDYLCTEYAYLDREARRSPKRGDRYLNCGNFVVFLAACGLLERVTFVSHPDWSDDYNPIYMKDFDSSSNVLQIKRFPKTAKQKLSKGIHLPDQSYDVDLEVPFERISRDGFHAACPPDLLLVTHSRQYTPACADGLYDTLVDLIDPLPADV